MLYKTPKREAYISMQEKEIEAIAGCGCKVLDHIDGIMYFQCRLHENAIGLVGLADAILDFTRDPNEPIQGSDAVAFLTELARKAQFALDQIKKGEVPE